MRHRPQTAWNRMYQFLSMRSRHFCILLLTFHNPHGINILHQIAEWKNWEGLQFLLLYLSEFSRSLRKETTAKQATVITNAAHLQWDKRYCWSTESWTRLRWLLQHSLLASCARSRLEWLLRHSFLASCVGSWLGWLLRHALLPWRGSCCKGWWSNWLKWSRKEAWGKALLLHSYLLRAWHVGHDTRLKQNYIKKLFKPFRSAWPELLHP